jgi:hypothetical protein
MNLADTHSAETANRYYHKRNIKLNASKAVALTKSLYDRMNRTTAATAATPTTTDSLLSATPVVSVVSQTAAAALNAASSSASSSSLASASVSVSPSASAVVAVDTAPIPVIDPAQLLKLFITRRRVQAATRMRNGSGMYYVTRAIVCVTRADLRSGCASIVCRER